MMRSATSVTALCERGHSWPARQTLEHSSGPLGLGFKIERIIEPPTCPDCGDDWSEVKFEVDE